MPKQSRHAASLQIAKAEKGNRMCKNIRGTAPALWRLTAKIRFNPGAIPIVHFHRVPTRAQKLKRNNLRSFEIERSI
jgi:hypothetical protein